MSDPPNIVTTSTANARWRSAREPVAPSAPGAGVAIGDRPVCRAAHIAAPVPIDTRPGTTNAVRQPNRSISVPATIPAEATPTLPKMPLTPSALPRVAAVRTSQGSPTG